MGPVGPEALMATQKQFDTFLAGYPPGVQDVARKTRTLLASVAPGIEERVDASSKIIGYGYGPGYKGVVFTVIPSQKEIKLGIARGSALPDPKGLMTGAGKVHRHVPIRSVADLKQPGLRPLLAQALAAWRKRNPDVA
jgi:hypothetical protein